MIRRMEARISSMVGSGALLSDMGSDPPGIGWVK
jgi:hypothetical protein